MTRMTRYKGALAGIAVLLPTLAGGGAQAQSTLTRLDLPAVVTGEQVPELIGAVPDDIVGFRYQDGWVQIPVQVDEKKWFNLRNAYPADFACGGNANCFAPGNRALYTSVYADPKTLTGDEIDETLVDVVLDGVPPAQTVTNYANLDADDEIALMNKDAGVKAPDGEAAPVGVVDNGVEVRIEEPTEEGSGEGYVYLFVRDADAQEPLEQSAGVSYVEYSWVVDHIQLAHLDDSEATENYYKTEYRFNGGTVALGNPETSYVQTAHYRREMTGRWKDNGLQIFRGGASGVSLLDRHDASLTSDLPGACIRDQNTFDYGEAAFVTSKVGAIRAIRDSLGTNSGPLVQRRHVFYESHEIYRVDLRVHAIPGPRDIWNWSHNAIGMRYSEGITGGTSRIDAIPDSYTGTPANSITPDSWFWESVDVDTVSPLPTDPDPQGGVSMVGHYDAFNNNSSGSNARIVFSDGGVGGCKNTPSNAGASAGGGSLLVGAISHQTPANMANTDANSAGVQPSWLNFSLRLHYEAPGTTNGPLRLQQHQNPSVITATAR